MMKRVYSTDSVAMAWHISNCLEQHGINSTVKNANLYSVAGELPVTECMPEVWVNRLDFSRAERLIREIETGSAQAGPDWQCAHCDEVNGDSFACCWNCQQPREP